MIFSSPGSLSLQSHLSIGGAPGAALRTCEIAATHVVSKGVSPQADSQAVRPATLFVKGP